MFSGSHTFLRKRLPALLLVAAVAVLACACQNSAAPAEQAPAVITPAPILADLPLTADGEAVDYAAYILGEWVSSEPVVDGTWYLCAKYTDGGIAGLRAVKPKGSVVDYSQFNEDNWTFGELTPGTYEINGDQVSSVFNGQEGAYMISWEFYDVMTLDSGAGDATTYYRVA